MALLSLQFILFVILPLSAFGRDSRIIGGTNADISEFPWVVSVRRYGLHICGGSILSDIWILTAAHCTENSKIPDSIQYGTTKIAWKGPNVVKVKRAILHEDYVGLKYSVKNDIALLLLDSPIDMAKVKSVQLVPMNLELEKESAQVVGWGKTKNSSPHSSKILQKLTINVLSNEQCKAEPHHSDTRIFLCGEDKLLTGVCFGDSGGPLMRSKDGTQIGIVSHLVGYVCGFNMLFPELYTKVSHYIDWIEEKTDLKF